MFDGKFICTLAAVVIAVVAICNFNPGGNKVTGVVEGLGMLPSFKIRPNMVARSKNGNVQAIQGTYQSMLKPRDGLAAGIDQKVEFWQTPGTFQSSLSPRFANTDFGANIRYNAPAYKNMGVPKTPLGYAKMAKENYKEDYGCGGCGGAGCFAATCGGPTQSQSPKGCGATPAPPIMPADYANGNYHKEVNAVIDSANGPAMTNELPVGNMTTLNNMGETTDNVIVYDRMMFANRNSTLRSQGDWIRGDLPITPCNTGWFQVSVDPSIDLNQGAINVLAGVKNETAGQMAALINDYTGETTIGGINMSQQELASVGASGNDIMMTAFP